MAALTDASCLVGKAGRGPRHGVKVGAQSLWQAPSLAQHSGAQQAQEHPSLGKLGLVFQGSQGLQVCVSHVPGDCAGLGLMVALRRQEGQMAHLSRWAFAGSPHLQAPKDAASGALSKSPYSSLRLREFACKASNPLGDMPTLEMPVLLYQSPATQGTRKIARDPPMAPTMIVAI